MFVDRQQVWAKPAGDDGWQIGFVVSPLKINRSPMDGRYYVFLYGQSSIDVVKANDMRDFSDGFLSIHKSYLGRNESEKDRQFLNLFIQFVIDTLGDLDYFKEKCTDDGYYVKWMKEHSKEIKSRVCLSEEHCNMLIESAVSKSRLPPASKIEKSHLADYRNSDWRPEIGQLIWFRKSLCDRYVPGAVIEFEEVNGNEIVYVIVFMSEKTVEWTEFNSVQDFASKCSVRCSANQKYESDLAYGVQFALKLAYQMRTGSEVSADLDKLQFLINWANNGGIDQHSPIILDDTKLPEKFANQLKRKKIQVQQKFKLPPVKPSQNFGGKFGLAVERKEKLCHRKATKNTIQRQHALPHHPKPVRYQSSDVGILSSIINGEERNAKSETGKFQQTKDVPVVSRKTTFDKERKEGDLAILKKRTIDKDAKIELPVVHKKLKIDETMSSVILREEKCRLPVRKEDLVPVASVPKFNELSQTASKQQVPKVKPQMQRSPRMKQSIPDLALPLDKGWCREISLRKNDTPSSVLKFGDVYYHSPENIFLTTDKGTSQHRLRSGREISRCLEQNAGNPLLAGLDSAKHFSFNAEIFLQHAKEWKHEAGRKGVHGSSSNNPCFKCA